MKKTPGDRQALAPEPVGPKRTHHMGGGQHLKVVTKNIGGSRDALMEALDMDAHVLLVQEHRVDGAGLPSAQAAAMGASWHGVWGPATASSICRSGGTAVLVRRPTQIVRGGRMHKGTVAVICWTRRSRLHVASVYNAQSTDEQAEETSKIVQDWQDYLAGLGSVPWILGGIGTWSRTHWIRIGSGAE